MSRRDDIKELLNEADELIKNIADIYERAKNDISIKSLPRVKLKGALEHLRSALDYSALDVYEKLYRKKSKNIYIPYGDTKENFDKAIEKIFPKLSKFKPEIYEAIESFQPHILGVSTIVTLCKLTNENKHDKLTTPKNESKQEEMKVGNIALFQGGGGGGIKFVNCWRNGVPMGIGGVVTLTPSMSDMEILAQINPALLTTVTRSAGRVRFVLEGRDLDSLEFLIDSKKLVTDMTEKIYRILG